MDGMKKEEVHIAVRGGGNVHPVGNRPSTKVVSRRDKSGEEI
jgi:hypothetical protein